MIRAQTTQPPITELALTLRLDATEQALLRVLSTLHRRRCRVTAARFEADGGRDLLALRLQAPAARAAQVERWLASLVEVRGVEPG